MTTFLARLLAVCCAALMPIAPVKAQPASRPITVVVPFPPGGINDTIARLVTQKMGEVMQTNFVIDNRAGASGTIGTSAVVRAAPDGHTLLLGATSTMAVVPHMMSVPYDPVRDFAAVGGLASVPSVLITNDAKRFPDFAAVLAESKKHPGQLTFGSAGLGTSHHVQMSFLNLQTGMSMLHVPYKGGNPAMADLLGGQINFLMDPTTTTLPQAQAGKVTALAITSATRSPLLPDVPTFTELGVRDFVISSWFALFAPSATPPDVIKQLSAALQAALQAPDIVRAMQARGIDPMYKSPQEMADYLREENILWARVMSPDSASRDSR